MKNRLLVPELMDDPGLDPVEHRRALRGLRRINAICQTGKHLAREILQIASERQVDSLSVLDLGCGSGDVATDVGRRLDGKLECNITGWDISPTAISFANEFYSKKQTSAPEKPKAVRIHFQQADALSATDAKFDIVYCCLFLHHFSEQQAIEMLGRMKSLARCAVLVDDLQRTSLGLLLAKIGCYTLSRSPVVHFDGPQSVRAAFTTDEAMELAKHSGMTGGSIRRHWPERYLLRWDVRP